MNDIITRIAKSCRVCDGPVREVLDLGEIYINDFPEEPNLDLPKAPLVLDQCEHCKLVQTRHTVNHEILYQDYYWYQSGLNSKLRDNLLDIAQIVNEHTEPGDSVLDIGANDGTLLSGVDQSRVRIGCEPAPNLIPMLRNHADHVIADMWHHSHMSDLARAITAIGMFYDMDNPNQFIRCVRESLAHDGIFIAQLMTLAPMINKFDLGNICHEHLEFYSYKSLVTLFENNGLEIYKIVENDIQGGSYQIWARHYQTGSIEYDEDISGLNDFADMIYENGRELREYLFDARYKGKSCYVYGASTKGNTLLQIWDLHGLFDGAAEIHPDKIGRYTVGTNIPIVSEQEARANADVFFVPNFGFRDLFVQKEQEWIKNGGEMVFGMPNFEVVK